MTGIKMTPNKPYMVKAVIDWVLDNKCTPHIGVDASVEGVVVPQEQVDQEQGTITLDLSPAAVRDFDMTTGVNGAITFNAKFKGEPWAIVVPFKAIYVVFALETGDGMAFPLIDDNELDEPTPPRPSGKPTLKVVK